MIFINQLVNLFNLMCVNKLNPDIVGKNDYDDITIKPGDALSDNLRVAAIEGNKTTEHTKMGLVEDGRINTAEGIKSVITSIDGVGTKVQIYSNAFELYVKEFEINGSREEDKLELIEISTKIWKRMFHDLIAMNVDDLRSGEMGVVFTNILDINHVKGIRGEIFAESFPESLKRAIKDIGINSGNGEVAILGESQKFAETLKDTIIWAKEELVSIKDLRKIRNKTDDLEVKKDLNNNIKNTLSRLQKGKNELIDRANKLEFNIGGTGEGVEGMNEKLVEIKAGHKIIIFSEDPTENGILSPRSNGITRIRELVHNLAGKDWEILKFEEFLDIIGEEKAEKIPDDLKEELSGLRMWDIVTGETTVFNPFISGELLGGNKDISDQVEYSKKGPLEKIIGSFKSKYKELLGYNKSDESIEISSIIHITGNPLEKFASGIPDDRLMAKVDASELKSAQIIDLLQYVGEELNDDGEIVPISDESSKSSWNGNMPFAIIVPDESVEAILNKVNEKNKTARVVGEVVEKDLKDYNRKVIIESAGINGDTVEKIEEIDRDMPDLPERYNHTHSGKVRETYDNPDNPDEMILIATDRISTHDVVHQSLIKGKGAALTQVSNYWFEELKNNPETSEIRTHMVENPIWAKDFPDELKEKAVIVKKVKALPIEAIVRGYLYGSVLKKYNSKTGKLSTGQFVGKGLKKCSKFDEPMFTPSTKGETDININFDNMHEELAPWLEENGYEGIDARELADQVKEMSLKIYKFANEKAGEKGDILGDTKFEFGLDSEGNIVLIDEVLTPDSSRFWKTETFEEGKEPDSSDKQPVRNYVSNVWKDKPRSDNKKYPVILGKDIIHETEIDYAGMRLKYN